MGACVRRPTLTFIQYLEELVAEQAVKIPADELDLLVARFGDRVRQMGRWNVSGDGSLEIPVNVVREAATQLESHTLMEAVQALKTGQFAEMLNSCAAVSLIERITDVYRVYFRDLMNRYQSTDDPSEAVRLRDQLVKEIFG